jgi:hypothetical protein
MPELNGSHPVRNITSNHAHKQASRTGDPPCTSEMLFGLTLLWVWIVLFTAGSIIGTAPYRAKLPGADLVTGLRLWFWVLTCYTVTNVALLCCLSSCLGTLGRRTRIGGNERADRYCSAGGQYIAAIMRGFFVYVTLLSGMIILTGTTTFANADQQTYLRLAGTASLFSFLAGYSPHLFNKLQSRLDDLMEERYNTAEHCAPPAPAALRNGEWKESVSSR